MCRIGRVRPSSSISARLFCRGCILQPLFVPSQGKRQQQQPEERGRLSLSDPGNLRCAPPLTQCPALSSRSPAAAGSSRIPVASGPSSPSSSVWVPRDRAGSDPRREPLLPEGLRAQHASHRCRRPGARWGSIISFSSFVTVTYRASASFRLFQGYRPVHALTFAYDLVCVISYDEKTDWPFDAVYEVTHELHFTIAKILRYWRDQTYVLPMRNGHL